MVADQLLRTVRKRADPSPSQGLDQLLGSGERHHERKAASFLQPRLCARPGRRGTIPVGKNLAAFEPASGRGLDVLMTMQEKTNCLDRVSYLNQSHHGIRRNRKALLSDLSSLVKVAKALEIAAREGRAEVSELELDDMVVKAFKMVNRAVKFLDIWIEAMENLEILDKFQDNPNIPPTPPAERADFRPAETGRKLEIPEPAPELIMEGEGSSARQESEEGDRERERIRSRHGRLSQTFNHPESATACTQHRNSSTMQQQRHSVSHRASCGARPSGWCNSNLASEKLSACHDTFLGFLGSFIGLHLQSRLSAELFATTQLSIKSCRDMLLVVEAIWERDGKRSERLGEARNGMYDKITDLVGAARNVFQPVRAGAGDDVLVPAQSKPLVDAATACVRVAGECVAESRFVIERIGDFECEPLGSDGPNSIDSGKDLADTSLQERSQAPSSQEPEEPTVPLHLSCRPPSPPGEVHAELPMTSARSGMSDNPNRFTWPSKTMPPDPSTPRTRSSSQSVLPSVGAFPTLPSSHQDYGVPSHRSVTFADDPSRVNSFDVSSACESDASHARLRDSEASAISQTSTRATSPDMLPPHCLGLPSGSTSFSGSQLTLNDESEEAEVGILEKTYAHELVYNKDGQISGGTLPALIERLTTYDSTPDATFVSTFYLTFRLFATPVEFAEALIDRFNYVGESPRIAGPVRLRVYNVFKGWLESHWRNDCDSPALELILPFATRQLLLVLPTAGKRLAALAEKVGATGGPLVPRLVSSMGKTNTSIGSYVAPDTPMPAPIITKSQLAALKHWKNGGASVNILDFDPLELARQFTIKESRIFCSILPEELLATEWMKKSGSMAVNVRAMSTLSTDLANLVADSILQLEDPKKRAAVIKQWVKIANKCLELANYDSLIAIICSLNTSTILRLERTWGSVSSKTKALLEQLKAVVDVSRNYAVLRQRLQNHVPPCLPFVGTYLTDLTFVDVGNQTTRQLCGEGIEGSKAVINFDKHMKTAKIISDLQRFQIPYRFVEIPELQTWIQDQLVRVRSSNQSDVLSYYRRSLILEPREPNSVRASPVESQSSYFSNTATTKDKFDLFGIGWGHFKDKGLTTPRVTTPT